LCLLKVLALLKDLAVGAMFTVRVGHDCVVSLVFAELEVMLSSKLHGPGAGPRPCQATSKLCYVMLESRMRGGEGRGCALVSQFNS
jgi:hypothetical protein